MKKERILALNVGSSSVKFSFFNDKLELLSTGKITNIHEKPIFSCGDETIELPEGSTTEDALTFLVDWISKHFDHVTVITHRVVHGDEYYNEPALVTAKVVKVLETLIPLAPLHQPHNLAGIDITHRCFPHIPQIACFDTAFHTKRDPLFTTYAIPQSLQSNIRKFGFHGLSYAWISNVLKNDYPDLYKGKVVVAHLGNGSSLCAMKEGKSVDTSMGMTTLSGLPMGTRCGNLDPGAIIYMIKECGLSVEDIEHILYEQSGLKGLSGLSNDVKTLLETNDPKASFAIDYYCMYVAQQASTMAVSLNGIDALIFTGGIGENSKEVRERILGHLSFLNIPQVLIIPANEEKQMALQTLDCLQSLKEQHITI
jgi:acetate kinase